MSACSNATVQKARQICQSTQTVSLTDVLMQDFPVILTLLGRPVFESLAKLFIQQHPPKLAQLTGYGDAFPAFIPDFLPLANQPYLASVAQLEIMRVQAFHAADATALNMHILDSALSSYEVFKTLTLVLHPSVHRLSSHYAVFSLWAAHYEVIDLARVNPFIPESVLIFRQNTHVKMLRLTAAENAFFKHLQTGQLLCDAIGQALDYDSRFNVEGALAALTQRGLITGISMQER